MELSEIIDYFDKKENRKIKHVKINDGPYLVSEDYGILIFSSPLVDSDEARIYFYYRNVKFFETVIYELKESFPLIEDWLIGKFSLKDMSKKYDIRIMPGIEYLNEDNSLYVKWKWNDLLDKPNSIDMLGYRPLFNLLKNSELNKLFPIFHQFEGLSFSKYIEGEATFPSIIFDDGKYLIHQNNGERRTVEKECTFDDVYKEYRKFLPQKIDWAIYPPTRNDHFL